ncbi:MAG: glycosyltransferase family protein, partial [Rhodothermales bacterium]
MSLGTEALVSLQDKRGSKKPRIALYSHDTCGLGHMRRNVLIAQTLARPPLSADILLITGAREANAFPIPSGVDVLSLPALFKQGNGRYRPRRFSFDVDELIALRARTIRTALEMFRPDVFIVDNVPRGAMGELNETLDFLHRHTSARCVLGLRDVLDHPQTIAREWGRADHFTAIRTSYHAVWIYGDPAVYDAAFAYHFPADVTARLTYTGYLDQKTRLTLADIDTAASTLKDGPKRPFYLCAVGGGQDGLHLAERFAATPLPDHTAGLILTGPYMDPAARRHLRHLGAAHPHLHLLPFTTEPMVLYQRAERVVSMGGYNTVCELLSLGKRALIVPRIRPRREQL